MNYEGRRNRERWPDALYVVATLAGLAALKIAATFIYALPHGHFPTMMIEMMGSRTILSNPGIAGYYERIFSREGTDIARPSGSETRESTKTNSPGFGEYEHTFRVYRLPPETLSLNRFGFVGHEWSQHKPPNTRRVVLLGDSITQGWGVNLNQTFGSLLEDRLNSTHAGGRSQRFEVLSLAVIGYNLTQILDVAVEDAPHFEPDVYVLPLTEISVFRNWDRHLVLLAELGIDPKYDFLRETLRKADTSEKDSSATLFAKLGRFRIPVVREMLCEIKATAEQHHAQFLVLLVPSLEDADLTRKRFDGIPELLESLHITYIDASDTFDGILKPEAASLQSFGPPSQLTGPCHDRRESVCEASGKPRGLDGSSRQQSQRCRAH